MGKKKRKCLTCEYAGSLSGMGELVCCDYAGHTGKSRVKQVYSMLRVDHMTPEAEQLLSGYNCIFYSEGARLALPREQICLRGSRPTRQKRRTKPTSYDWDKVAELWEQGARQVDIMAALGCSKGAVEAWQRRTGRTARRRFNNYKFDWERARVLWESGMKMDEICTELGCGKTALYEFTKREGLSRCPNKAPKAAKAACVSAGKTGQEE